MIVVTNAGPLIALAKLGLLHLLGRLYGTVLMPGAVYDEVVLRVMEDGGGYQLREEVFPIRRF